MTTVALERGVRDQFAHSLSARIGQDRFRRFFGQRDSIAYEDGRLRVSAGSAFQAEMLSRRFGSAMRDAADACTHGGVSVEVRVRGAKRPGDEPAETTPPPVLTDAPPARPAPERPARAGRAPGFRHSLDDFVVGPSNRLAHDAAVRLVEDGPSSALSPLFFHGACGTGKTHLLQGLAKRTLDRRPGARVKYTTGEAFTNAFIRAVRENRTAAFHAEHRRLDLLCIDDVHFLASKTATQGELLHTLNALSMSGAQIAMASDEHPSVIKAFSRELTSRFMAGMVVELEAPDADLRAALVAAFAARQGVALDQAGVELIAAHAMGSAREIEGTLVRVAGVARLSGERGGSAVTAATIRRALQLGSSVGPTRPVRAEAIIDAAAGVLGVEVSDILGRGRHRRVVAARSIAAVLSRKLTTLSYPELAVKLGRPNHSSVVTACQRFEKQLAAGGTIRLTPGEPETPLADLLHRVETEVKRGAPRG